MSELVLATNDDSEEQELVITYKPTEKDEEKFYLMYFMHLQPSEIDAMTDEYRQWLIARFTMQKNMEKEMMQQARLAQSLDLSKLKL